MLEQNVKKHDKVKNNYDYIEIMQIVCDNLCKYSGHLEQEALDEQCEKCPLEKILNN